LQILAGESFLVLLRAQNFEILDRFLVEMKDLSLWMLQQWSADILEVWVEVYAMTLA
jgi:hypothetical protein